MISDILNVPLPLIEKVVRTLLVYFFLILMLRLFGKRELAQLNPFDLIVLLMLSNTVQNAIIGNDNSLLGGLLGAAVLFLVNEALVRFVFRHPRARRLIEGRPDELIKDGKILRAALRRNMITREELETAARKQGIEHLHDVESARLEVSGSLSFALHEPGTAGLQHEAVMARLAAIELRLAAIAPNTRA